MRVALAVRIGGGKGGSDDVRVGGGKGVVVPLTQCVTEVAAVVRTTRGWRVSWRRTRCDLRSRSALSSIAMIITSS